MRFEELLGVVKSLPFEEKRTICIDSGTELYLLRPTMPSQNLKHDNYDPLRNFQIWLKEGDHPAFMPNHLRVLIDLNLRSRTRPDLKRELLAVVDNIFYGADPDTAIGVLLKEHFSGHLNSLRIIANLHQLFIAEQLHGYPRESNYDPPSLFFQGWVRCFIDSPKEIDEMCMRAGKGYSAPVCYTSRENRKRKRIFTENLPRQWYLDPKK